MKPIFEIKIFYKNRQTKNIYRFSVFVDIGFLPVSQYRLHSLYMTNIEEIFKSFLKLLYLSGRLHENRKFGNFLLNAIFQFNCASCVTRPTPTRAYPITLISFCCLISIDQNKTDWKISDEKQTANININLLLHQKCTLRSSPSTELFKSFFTIIYSSHNC